jgi:hypothetical protein
MKSPTASKPHQGSIDVTCHRIPQKAENAENGAFPSAIGAHKNAKIRKAPQFNFAECFEI